MSERETPERAAAQPGEAPGGAEPSAEEKMRQDLEKARAEAADNLEQLRRARADYANYKRRCDQERAEIGQTANAMLILKLLPALDDLERAFRTLPAELSSLTWTDGVLLIHRKLQAALESEGLKLIEAKGRFDPAVHEAVTHELSADHEEGDILGEVQKGYRLGERVLRPSLVRVARKSE
jgi:molecular chaperone GrpE